MKTIEQLNGIQLMDQKELLETSGGVAWFIPVLIAGACAAVEEIIRDWDNFKAGLLGKPEITH